MARLIFVAHSNREITLRHPNLRVLGAKQREEDIQFRERLLSEIERRNQLLETLIAKIAAQN